MSTRLVSTGTIVKMYLSENGFSYLDLANASNVSLRTIIRIVNDERPLGVDAAIGLNKLIPEIKTDFLVSYDSRYQLQKQILQKSNSNININSVISKYQMKKLYPNISGDELKLFDKAKEIFGLENILDNFKVDTKDLLFCFSLAKGEKENNHLIWLKAAYFDCMEENGNNLLEFNRDKFSELFSSIKSKTFTKDIYSTLYNMKSFCKKTGINFYYRKSIPNARVKAVAVKDINGRIFIFVSDLFKCIENLWLAFIHECIHILNDDFKHINEIKNTGVELEINENFVDEESIAFFIGKDYKISDLESINSIDVLANNNNSPLNIVCEIARFKTHEYQKKELNKYINYYSLIDGAQQS